MAKRWWDAADEFVIVASARVAGAIDSVLADEESLHDLA